MGIAEAYKEHVDPDMEFDDDEIAGWAETGLDVFVEETVTALVGRWQLMNVYIAGGMERGETAKVARQVARNTCSWLMHVATMEAYDWTYNNRSSLMPDSESEEYRVLAHQAASLEIGDWLAAWREAAMARMQWFCTISDRSLNAAASPNRRSLTRRINKTAHAIQREIDGVLHAIHEDASKPKRRQADMAEEE